MSSFKIMSGIGILAVLFGILSSFFTVDQTQQALVLQFGEPKRLVNKPGLNFKIPFLQTRARKEAPRPILVAAEGRHFFCQKCYFNCVLMVPGFGWDHFLNILNNFLTTF